MALKIDWRRWSVGVICGVAATMCAGTVSLSLALAAPADQPSSLAPANEQPQGQNLPPADTGPARLPGPPNPFAEEPTAQPRPLQGPAGQPSAQPSTTTLGPGGSAVPAPAVPPGT